jgi:putative Holliday junction resolvase
VTPVDESYTSRIAETALIEGGVRRRKRRGSVDKVAAAVILRTYLDRSRGES